MTERLEGSRETQREQCPHINCAGHEWESWCMDCGERWPNNLHNKSTFVSTPAAPETPPERSEDFWINACLHILYCQKEWSKKCPVCHRIAEIVTAEKEAVVTGEFLEAGTPRKEEARENR